MDEALVVTDMVRPMFQAVNSMDDSRVGMVDVVFKFVLFKRM